MKHHRLRRILKTELHKRTLLEQESYDKLNKDKEKIKEILPLVRTATRRN